MDDNDYEDCEEGGCLTYATNTLDQVFKREGGPQAYSKPSHKRNVMENTGKVD